jgi:uncharacterized membrane protein
VSYSLSPTMPRTLHPLHVLLLVGAACYLVTGLLCDWLYFTTYEIQWKNFASWLIMGGLVLGGLALLWSIVDVMRSPGARGSTLARAALLLAAWVVSLVNELVHAKDAWASMPEALVLSVLAAFLIVGATWLGLGTLRHGARI